MNFPQVDVFYFVQPVDSSDQAMSLASYLNEHGVLAHQADNADHAVEIPVECSASDEVATRSADIHSLIKTWRLYWEHSDAGLWGLPVYSKDDC